jgi:hypothetical protein
MSGLTWRKSSYSGNGTDNANCVELAARAVRDSKNPGGPVLNVQVMALITAVKAGQIAG